MCINARSFSRRFAVAAVAALAVGYLARGAAAVQPSLGGISPIGLTRGGEVEVTFSGARLADAQELLFYRPGITVASLEPGDSAVKAKLQVAADCPLGIHAVRVRTATGISDLRTFSVGALPVVPEVEPNSEFASPQAISLDVTVHGVVENEDVDYYVVEAKKGERITAELEGIRLGLTFFDPYVAILNAERFELASSDDTPLLRQDCLVSVVAPEDGKYIVQVRESAYGGNGACVYRLHVGRFPRPTAVVPAGGVAGETVSVQLLGDAAGPVTREVTLPTDGSTQFEFFASDEHGISPSPNVLRVGNLRNAIEAEPNNAREQATDAGEAPVAMGGVIGEMGDIDTFRFTAKQGQQFDIRVLARNTLRSPLDPVLAVLNADGGTIAANDDSGGPDSYLRFGVPADGAYYIVVRDHLGKGGENFAYRVEITPVEPTLTMSLPERQQYVPVTLSVPRGNRMALMVGASRANFGGELAIDFPDLPAGMTFQTVPLAADRSDVVVLFSAAADAPLDGTLADLVGRPTDANLAIEGHLRQRTGLVRGQNNIDVWGHDAERMAVAVTEQVPYSIEIVQPKVPLVRNGSMELKVVAQRAEGFNAAIGITLLYAPPGVGASGSVSIPEGQNEAVIPLTANGGAAIQKWPLVVMGRAGHAGGTVEVASQMAELEIADSFFNFAFQKAAVEKGQQSAVLINIESKTPFEGEAKVELLGLPAGTSTGPEPLAFNKDAKELVFPVQAAADARAGKYNSLVCRAIMIRDGEPITHTLGTGELRVDEPPPKPVDQPQPEAKPEPQPEQVAAPPPPKPLSRLEQLRLQKEKEREAKGESTEAENDQ